MATLRDETMRRYGVGEYEWFGPDNWGDWGMVIGNHFLCAIDNMLGTDIKGSVWKISTFGEGTWFASSWRDTSEGRDGYPDVEAAKVACLNYYRKHVAQGRQQ